MISNMNSNHINYINLHNKIDNVVDSLMICCSLANENDANFPTMHTRTSSSSHLSHSFYLIFFIYLFEDLIHLLNKL